MPLLILCIAATSASAASIIDEVIAAYGGASVWSGIESIRQKGVVGTTMRGQGGILTRELTPPGRLLIVIEYPTSTEVRSVDGRTGFRDGEPVTGPQLDAMRLQCARMDLPRLLLARRSAIVDHGVRTRDGREIHLLEIPLPDGLGLLAEVDVATKHIVHTTGSLPLPNGGRMSFENDYSDFRMVNGRLFAFREVSIAGGVVTGETRLEKIEVREKA